MRVVGIVALVVGALVVLILVIGWSLPVAHQVTRSATLKAPAGTVFDLVSHPNEFPLWRSDVKRVEALPPDAGHDQYREIGKNGSILFRVDSVVPNQRLITRIADKSLPFGGTWTYDVVPQGESTTLRITEDGEVYNPVFRFVSRFIMGHTATIDQYLADVQRRLGAAKQ
jgi:uncharacterized protein YndB with AHSA1/START domain